MPLITTVTSQNRLDSYYEKWAAGEGIPIIRGYAVEDMYKIPLEPWKRTGGKGAFIHLEGGEGSASAYVCEIPPGASLKPQRHLFEARIYVLQGEGETTVWNEGGKKQTFAWHEYSVFSPPLNTWYQSRNTGDQPAKYVAVTDAPLIFNVFRNADFIFNTSFVFRDRYNGESNYFDGVGKIVENTGMMATWQGGFIPDVNKVPKRRLEGYGAARFSSMALDLSANTLEAHLGVIDVGTYNKPHRHICGAHLIIIDGTGFACLWEREWSEVVKADFKKGSMYSPPENWWHCHACTSAEPVKQVAFRYDPFGVGRMYLKNLGLKKGGDMLERDEEPPELNQLFEAELAKNGLKSHMPPA